MTKLNGVRGFNYRRLAWELDISSEDVADDLWMDIEGLLHKTITNGGSRLDGQDLEVLRYVLTLLVKHSLDSSEPDVRSVLGV